MYFIYIWWLSPLNPHRIRIAPELPHRELPPELQELLNY